MKNLYLLLILSLILCSCSKDDNPVNSNNTNTGTSWNLIYSKTDSLNFTNSFFRINVGYVNADSHSYKKFKIEYSYCVDSGFTAYLRSGFGEYQYWNSIFQGIDNKWHGIIDSSTITSLFHYDSLYYGIRTNRNVYIKNILISVK